jgi:hypothetical protein
MEAGGAESQVSGVDPRTVCLRGQPDDVRGGPDAQVTHLRASQSVDHPRHRRQWVVGQRALADARGGEAPRHHLGLQAVPPAAHAG